jgi:hypothetical protein
LCECGVLTSVCSRAWARDPLLLIWPFLDVHYCNFRSAASHLPPWRCNRKRAGTRGGGEMAGMSAAWEPPAAATREPRRRSRRRISRIVAATSWNARGKGCVQMNPGWGWVDGWGRVPITRSGARGG